MFATSWSGVFMETFLCRHCFVPIKQAGRNNIEWAKETGWVHIGSKAKNFLDVYYCDNVRISRPIGAVREYGDAYAEPMDALSRMATDATS